MIDVRMLNIVKNMGVGQTVLDLSSCNTEKLRVELGMLGGAPHCITGYLVYDDSYLLEFLYDFKKDRVDYIAEQRLWEVYGVVYGLTTDYSSRINWGQAFDNDISDKELNERGSETERVFRQFWQQLRTYVKGRWTA